MSSPNRQGRGYELSDASPQGNVTVIDVERRLGLVDATATHRGKDVQY